MPKLKRKQETKKVNLPSYPKNDPGWVEILTRPTVSDILVFSKIIDPVEKAYAVLEMLIVKWNLESEDGSEADITKENIGMLYAEDLIVLIEEANKYLPKDLQFEVQRVGGKRKKRA